MYELQIATSSDSQFIGVGDTFYVVFNCCESNAREERATITEIVCDGDIDDEGKAFGYVDGATAKLADGREVYLNAKGMGDLDGEKFDSQKESIKFYEAFDIYRAGGKLTLQQKGYLIGGLDVASTVDGRVNAGQAVEIAKILGDVESFYYFDRLAGSGGCMADLYGAYKVRQARNMNIDGKAIFFDALAEAEASNG